MNFIKGDIKNQDLLDNIFATYPIETVIHFAGLKAVGESVSKPLEYYDNNVHGSSTLFKAMEQAGVRKIVFSSSATVYGQQPQESMPIKETASRSHTNPYGHTKLLIEDMLHYQHQAAVRSNSSWKVALLRYFNPIGAHPSGEIGEDPKGIPNNLMPYITQVSAGKRPYLRVYKGYNTSDRTGIRDYIHVVDLAKGHLKAIEKLQEVSGVHAWNLGVGEGYSVYQMLARIFHKRRQVPPNHLI
ncbi:UDP-glucose 4-epimerase [Endozoicomonas montiporae CL-33]|uniref:UDP-glucose 4-epimerase n=1 Tax=Endozoicomonas montiporae CL-33 TaxID=570277 RepID=A0A142B6V3_9GAMM|nr:UDP-glucose 4-epimerase [Endozoicomonas montiporae CL-33]